jgi:hypothetical protein
MAFEYALTNKNIQLLVNVENITTKQILHYLGFRLMAVTNEPLVLGMPVQSVP